MDKITKDRIGLLHPKVRDEITSIIEEVEKTLTGRAKIRISQGLRTIEEQNKLYNQGRTTPGKIVTNARGGSSYHNYGLAIDFVLIIDGKEASWDIKADWDNDTIADWIEVVSIFKKYNWEWGGNFKTIKDYPHFQKTFGYSIDMLRKKYNNNDFINGSKIYLNL